jgi:uncharacterized protein YlxW (UPF0749 family)
LLSTPEEGQQKEGAGQNMEALIAAALLILGSALTWLGQWVVPRVRKNRAVTEALREEFTFIKQRLQWAEERVEKLENEISDLYKAINMEEAETSRRIWSRVISWRSERSGREN